MYPRDTGCTDEVGDTIPSCVQEQALLIGRLNCQVQLTQTFEQLTAWTLSTFFKSTMWGGEGGQSPLALLCGDPML